MRSRRLIKSAETRSPKRSAKPNDFISAAAVAFVFSVRSRLRLPVLWRRERASLYVQRLPAQISVRVVLVVKIPGGESMMRLAKALRVGAVALPAIMITPKGMRFQELCAQGKSPDEAIAIADSEYSSDGMQPKPERVVMVLAADSADLGRSL